MNDIINKLHYYKKFPLALAVSGDICTIQLNHIKKTDSTFGVEKN